jgi:hypothetical protein
MPTPTALKTYLFPGSFAVVSDDQAVRIVRRIAFPDLTGWMTSPAVSILVPAIQQAQRAAAVAAAANARRAGPAAVPGAAVPPAGNPAQPQPQPATRERDPRGTPPTPK